MIGLIGQGGDPCLARVAQEAQAGGIPCVFIDEDRLADAALRIDMRGPDLAAVLRTGDAVIDLDHLSGIYCRPLGPADPGQGRAGAIAAALHDWLDATAVPCFNRPEAMRSNASKPYQAQLITAFGLATPPTLVTNDPELVRAFVAQHDRVIYKSVSGVRSIVRELDAAALRRLDRLPDLPVQFQAYVEGVDVRVHVVGDRIYADRIVTPAVDYRYAASDGLPSSHEPITLEPALAQTCIEVSAGLGLPLAGIDLRITPAGDAVCFEVNPMPAFSWFEGESGLPIAAGIVEVLSGVTLGLDDVSVGAVAVGEGEVA
ncbi:MAG: hypothetical protein KBB39_11800 [Phycicoccus sp.]|nr:hypothetical protein [Phycicoccus sp.]